MEDKSFELLSKMYDEFSRRFDSVEARLETLENGQKAIEKRIDKLELAIENEIKKDITGLYDGYRRIYEKLADVEQDVRSLSERIERQEVEIKVIKGGRQ